MLALVATAVGVESVPGQDGPEPAPWWMRVEEFQSLALKWLGMVSVVGGAIISAVWVLWTKYIELKERMNRATLDRQQLQAQVTDLAKQIPPPTPPVVPVIVADTTPEVRP